MNRDWFSSHYRMFQSVHWNKNEYEKEKRRDRFAFTILINIRLVSLILSVFALLLSRCFSFFRSFSIWFIFLYSRFSFIRLNNRRRCEKRIILPREHHRPIDFSFSSKMETNQEKFSLKLIFNNKKGNTRFQAAVIVTLCHVFT